MSRVGVISAGYLGKATGTYFKEKGYEGTFYDIKESVLKELRSRGFTETGEVENTVQSKYISLNVHTPTRDNRTQVLYYIIDAVANLTGVLKTTGDKYSTVVIKYTVIPRTTENIILPVFERTCNIDIINILYNPESLTKTSTKLEYRPNFISVHLHKKIKIRLVKPQSYGDIGDYGTYEKARRDLNFEPKWSFENGLKYIIDRLKAHLEVIPE